MYHNEGSHFDFIILSKWIFVVKRERFMSSLTLGVVGSSFKENELRVPIHPEQLDWIDLSVRKRMFFEVGYGERFQISDD
jgi:hypothetical protein